MVSHPGTFLLLPLLRGYLFGLVFESFSKPPREHYPGRQQIIASINSNIKLHVQNTIWCVSTATQSVKLAVFKF